MLPTTKCLFLAVLSLWLVGGAARAQSRPLYYEREITPADLEGRSLRELSLMRNTIYARAGNPFRKKWLAEYFASQPWYRPLPKMDAGKLTALDHKNARTIALYEEGLDRQELQRRYEEVMARRRAGQSRPEDEIEVRLLSAKLGRWLGEAQGPRDSARSPLEDPSLLDRLLTLEQLQDLSRRDLRLLRNTIYARRGRPFRSPILQQYFGDMEWYRPVADYTDKRLTDIDRRNIKLIRSVEDELGGPLSDREHREEDGWMFAA
ncbi:MAG: YARHG domain-containing protein [Myxococcales bacterium]|nr:YARHG domain-containing protein [Myxococcota bacterium]MDW8282203.1 YARHG domain-containing protein [Myxococcales bacterium]